MSQEEKTISENCYSCLPRKTTSERPKVPRTPQSFPLLTSTCASRHDGVQFFISHLARWLRIRRFSEPTFRPSGATNHWNNTVFRDFPTFSRTCIFFVLTLSLLSSSLLFSSLTLATSAFPSVHIVGSLTSKLPSATHPRNLTWNLRIGPGWSSHWTWQFLGYHV